MRVFAALLALASLSAFGDTRVDAVMAPCPLLDADYQPLDITNSTRLDIAQRKLMDDDSQPDGDYHWVCDVRLEKSGSGVEPESIPTPGAILPDLADGEVVKLNDLTCSGPDPICNQWTGYGGFTCTDDACYGSGGGHANTMTDTVFKMDFDSFAWEELYKPTPCDVQQDESALNKPHRSYIYEGHERPISGHSYDLLAVVGDYFYNLSARGTDGAWGVCSPPWLGAVMNKYGGRQIARLNLNTLDWEFMNSTWGVSREWNGGYPGSVVVDDTIYLYGHNYFEKYDPKTDTKTHLGFGASGYEVAVVYGDGVFYGVGHADNNAVAYSRTLPDNSIETLRVKGCGIRSHWGFEWDDRNKVVGAVQYGRYRFYDPAANKCGSVPIDSDLPSLSTSYHASSIVDGVLLFITPSKATYAYRIPDIAGYTPDNFGGGAMVDGVEFSSLSAAAAALTDGATMDINPGNYIEPFTVTANNVTVKGCDVHISDVQVGGKAAIVNKGNGNTFDCLEISGVKVNDLNGSAIRHEGCGITLKNVNFHDNQMGFMTGYDSCTTTIEGSTFRDNGHGDGYSHNMYVNSDTFILRNSKSLGAYVGHEVKSRSKYITIKENTIDSEDSRDSRLIDLPCGGVINISDNTLRQGPESENPGVIGIGWENCAHAEQSIVFEGNAVDIQSGQVLFDNVAP